MANLHIQNQDNRKDREKGDKRHPTSEKGQQQNTRPGQAGQNKKS